MPSYIDATPRAFLQGLRWMVRRPLVSLTSALCLAVGMAACALAWTLLDATIFRPFGLADSEELVVVWETDPARGHDLIEVSYLNFLDWQRESRTLEAMAAFGSQHWPALARMGSETVPLAARGVSVTFFATLGVRPAIGRDFAVSDAQPDVLAPVVLSHRLWQSRFASSPDVVSRTLFVDGEDRQIIGVMPRGFAYPDDPDVWISVERALGSSFSNTPIESQRQVGVLEVLGRRTRGVSNDDVRAELSGIIRSLHKRHQSSTSEPTVAAAVTPYADVLLGRLGARLWIALAMAAAVMLFACANVAAVRMANARERSSELAARLFLGATRARLLTELAFEAAPLVLVAAALSAALWLGLITLLSSATAIAESGVTLADHRGTSAVLVALLCVASWVLVGVLPAWSSSRQSVSIAQQSSSRVVWRTSRIGAPLLLGQAAVAITVVAIAGAALQTFVRLSRIDLGFATTGVTLIDINGPGWKYKTTADSRRLVDQLQAALRELPAVRHVAAVSVRPFRFGEIADGLPVRRTGDALLQPDDATGASRVVVTPDYFAALGQPIVAGRSFNDFDRTDSETVVILSRTLARALFGDQPAVGQRVDTFTLREKWRGRLVVGIVGDAQYRGLERPSMELYVPHTQAATDLGSLVVASNAPGALTDAIIRQALWRVEPEIAIERIQTTGELRQSVLSPARLLTTLVSLLGGAGLLLLALGIFGAAATALRAAWPEIAVRQAVGALPFQAARAPLRTLTRALAIGMVAGLALTPLALSAAEGLGLASAGTLVQSLSTGVVAVVLAALAATAPSIWRASRSSPAELLRER